MARAGFYPIQASQIRFAKDGRWYADGELISNARIADLFSRHIGRESDGTYAIRMADERATVEVEDTAFVVIEVTCSTDGAVAIQLNDHTEESLDLQALEVGDREVLYTRAKQGTERVRFLRPAYYQLAEHIVEATPGCFVLRLGTRTYPIRRG